MRMRIASLALASLALIGMPACGINIGDPGPPGEVGVSTTDGAILLRVQPCDSKYLVRSVALRVATGQAGVEGETVWEITSEAGSSRREYEVGRTPPGFVETVPVTAIRQEATYVAAVTTFSPRFEFVTDFVPGSLQPSLWEISTDEILTKEQFNRLHPCD